MRRILGAIGVVAAGLIPAAPVALAPAAPQIAAPAPAPAEMRSMAHMGHVHGADTVALDLVRGKRGLDVDVKAPWSKDQYDGVQLASDAPDLTELPSIHAIYVYPADATNRFSTFAPMFQADARQASNLFGTVYGRRLRLDERLGANRVRYLDITVVRSSLTTRQLTTAPFASTAYDLRTRGLASDPDKKYLVWLDYKASYCGQAELSQDTVRGPENASEQSSISLIYRPNDTRDKTTGGFCRGRSVAHELGHGLGAVLRVAPHAYDGAHCNDSSEDVMCNPTKNSTDTGAATIDWMQDDYWDPAANPAVPSTQKLPWWTVNLSRFVCPSVDCSKPNIPDY